MKTHLHTLSIQTTSKQQLIDITPKLKNVAADTPILSGIVGVFSQHTTAGLLVNEFQTALLKDIDDFLKKVVREDGDYRHNSPALSDCDRHNAASHLRSLLVNNSVTLPLSGGQVVLGRYQRIILAELDGPRERILKVQVMGD